MPLFVLMGEVMFHSGVAPLMLDTIDKWITRLPGRLALMAVAGGTLLATLTGTNVSVIVTVTDSRSVLKLGSVEYLNKTLPVVVPRAHNTAEV